MAPRKAPRHRPARPSWLAAAALLTGLAAAQDGPIPAQVEARLAPQRSIFEVDEDVVLALRAEVVAPGLVDTAILRGMHLVVEDDDGVVATLGAAGEGRLELPAETAVERVLRVRLPVEVTGGPRLLSVCWPDLPGAVASVRLVPAQDSLDVDALDLAAVRVLLVTNYGEMTLRFRPDVAPEHVRSFVELARSGFYDGTRFHRVIEGFMIQGGCPNTKAGARGAPGTGDPGYKLDAEFSDVRHVRGTLSMARGPGPNSAGCQFFICHGDAPQLDGQYSVFGMLEDGYDTLDRIAQVPVERDGQAARPLQPVHLHRALVLPAQD